MTESTTRRQDWLTEGLATQHGVFVSGSETFSKRIGATGELTLRVFGHHPAHSTPPANPSERRTWLPSHYEIPFVMLTCELETQESVSLFDPTAEEKIRSYLNGVLKLPVYLVAYSRENLDLAKEFHVTSPSNVSGLQVPSGFANEINSLRAGKPEDEPESRKLINSTVNDVFQTFTRSLVSWQFSINDIDVLITTPNGVVFLELKRSGVVPWQPYLKDAANYLLMRSLTKLVKNGIDFTLRYDVVNSCELDVHTILGISRGAIPGFSKKITGEDSLHVIEETLNLLRDPTILAY